MSKVTGFTDSQDPGKRERERVQTLEWGRSMKRVIEILAETN